MEKLLKIILGLMLLLALLVSHKIQAQDDPILGTWNFALNEKLNFQVMMDSAKSFGYDTSIEEIRRTLFVGITSVAILRCDYCEITFSSFENQVMIKSQRQYDISIIDTNWGTWSKISKNKYLLTFKNREEIYELNELTGNFYLKEHDNSIVSKILSDNLMLIKKGD